ncbi:class 1 isoprenoid biosynthesis enzyme [Clostridium sp.]|uniref:class 1 isoprenoid biosynthesis enzyme n=1 Tax=Clostridium sp. TaxID=1506 RepID=UPI003F3FC45D
MHQDNTNDIDFLNYLYRNMWWNSNTLLNSFLSRKSDIEKLNNEKSLDSFIKDLINHIKSFPIESSEKILWRENGLALIEDIILNQEIFKLGILDTEMKEQFFTSTKDFIKASKAFDKNISFEDIGQALRNIWIINIFQKIINEDIKFTMASFGYSMLYPYTDNYLDDTNITLKEKKNFNSRFTKRLQGLDISPINNHEKKVFKLVKYIEEDFERESFKDVYDKLLLIHEGQIKSLTQQDIFSIPYEKDILGISIEKGGTSVLADGYLINGNLTLDEEIFAYGYGFFLQLCDDLQDVKTDLENNHMTIMSQLAKNYPLDLVVNKLINLTIEVIDTSKCFKCENVNELKDLIKLNCVNMILFAIIDSKSFFSKEYIETIKDYLPFSYKYSLNFKKHILKSFKSLKPSYSNTSIEDIILYLIQ